MSPADLTRWNRAGLSRFRYVDANAATHLEALRIELADRFKQWRALNSAAPDDETAAERAARVIKQYRAERRDWAWETTRTFARALHILTEHIDAFANEGYLGTATQWQSVRRLAAMVGYTPAPASSATTPLVLIAKDEVTTATVQRGFAVKHIPADAPPVIFETLEDIEIAPALNALRLEGWNRNSQNLLASAVFALVPGTPPLWTIPKEVNVSAGGLAILAIEGTDTALAAVVTSVTDKTALTISLASAAKTYTDEIVLPGLRFDTARLHAAPSQILVPFLNGTDVVRVVAPHDLVAGDVVAWKVNGPPPSIPPPSIPPPSIWFAKVLEAGAGALRLQMAGTALPAAGTALFRAAPITFTQFMANDQQWRLPQAINKPRSGDFRITFTKSDGTLHSGLSETDLKPSDPPLDPLKPDGPKKGFTQFTDLALSNVQQIWFTDPAYDAPVATVSANLPAGTLEFDGKSTALASGELVILQTGTGYSISRIKRVDKDAASYRLVLADFGTVTAVHASFAATLRPAGHDGDPNPIPSQEFELDAQVGRGAEWPALLGRNRKLVFESASNAFAAFATRIASYEPDAGTIRIDRAVANPSSIRRGDLVIRANVVDAGHGETKPLRVLGSGDASTTNQRFAIDVDDVSHVRDTSMPGGVRADLKVEAEREIYSQVATLRDSEPTDPHYVVRITEAGTLELEFGDGRHGRRLPSGSNNVLATIRRGSGLDGNLPAAGLTDIVKKHPAIDSFLQPIAATGGDDREALDQIRQNAPGRLGAMDRAISVSDYQQLAQRFQGVWHAAAFEQPSVRRSREAVRIVIVPAGGGELGTLDGEIRSYLSANGLPSIDVAIELFVAVPVKISVRARVDSTRFDPREVEGRVRAAVLAAFDLRRRRPGQPIYRSEVTRIVENTDGVSNSDVVLFEDTAASLEAVSGRAARGDDGGIWAVFPKDNRVIYAAPPEIGIINVTTAEATI